MNPRRYDLIQDHAILFQWCDAVYLIQVCKYTDLISEGLTFLPIPPDHHTILPLQVGPPLGCMIQLIREGSNSKPLTSGSSFRLCWSVLCRSFYSR
ncbi:hypothetical protein BD777DRAFT_124471 [Yarrowia lipolytica]|nr:hypothetical protein BD777DRAFT_124471 [Yarrowia lipolytica]